MLKGNGWPDPLFYLERMQASGTEILILIKGLSQGKNSRFVIRPRMCGMALVSGGLQIIYIHRQGRVIFGRKSHRNRLNRIFEKGRVKNRFALKKVIKIK